MFKKKVCKNCRKKTSGTHDFCPYCGAPINNEPENQGLLGTRDIERDFENFSNPFFSGFGEKMFNKMLGSTMRMLEKEMQRGVKKESYPKTNIRLMINGKEINLNENKSQNNKSKQKKKNLPNNLSQENLKKLSSLPKQEPQTQIKRLANKIIYEVFLPDVKSIKDISIMKLETSIEIKALAKNKAYVKRIPINLPIINYNFTKDKLILELETKN